MAEMWGCLDPLGHQLGSTQCLGAGARRDASRWRGRGGFWGAAPCCKAFTSPRSTGTELSNGQIIPLMLLPAGPMRGGFLICAVSAERQVIHR